MGEIILILKVAGTGGLFHAAGVVWGDFAIFDNDDVVGGIIVGRLVIITGGRLLLKMLHTNRKII